MRESFQTPRFSMSYASPPATALKERVTEEGLTDEGNAVTAYLMQRWIGLVNRYTYPRQFSSFLEIQSGEITREITDRRPIAIT
jgi:hypothetical protein